LQGENIKKAFFFVLQSIFEEIIADEAEWRSRVKLLKSLQYRYPHRSKEMLAVLGKK
jgi:hypothetical protein